MCVRVCVCARARARVRVCEKERESKRGQGLRERETDRQTDRERGVNISQQSQYRGEEVLQSGVVSRSNQCPCSRRESTGATSSRRLYTQSSSSAGVHRGVPETKLRAAYPGESSFGFFPP